MAASMPGSLAYGTQPPPPLVAPRVPPMAPVAPFTPPSPGTYGAPVPQPSPYGDFTAPTGPDPYQFRVDAANRGANRSAAAHGTLLSGGFQASLARLNQGLASEETQNIYNRARDTYGMNRDTNAQNFGQSLASYGAGRDTFNANANAALGFGHLGLAASDANYGHARDAYHDAETQTLRDTDVQNANTGTMADWLNAQQQRRPMAATELPRPLVVPRPIPGAARIRTRG